MLISGLKTKLQSGLKDQLGSIFSAAASGPTELADLDFRTPATSWTTGRTGFGSAFSTNEWTISDTTYSGGYAGNVGAATLTNTGGLTAQTCQVLRTASGFGGIAWESAANTDLLTCSDTGVGDSDDEDVSGRLVFALNSDDASDYLFTKRTSTLAGWYLRTGSSGTLVFGIEDSAGNNPEVTLTGNHADGALHYVSFWYDYSADTIYIKSDITAEASASTASVVNSCTTAAPIVINGLTSLSGFGSPQAQIVYAGVCVGANAESMYDETFWQHGGDPTGLLTTIDRDCLIGVPLSASTVGIFAPDQLPIGYHSAFTSGLGLFCNSAATNLVRYSEGISNWVDVSMTVVDNDGDGPSGMRDASSMTATATGGDSWTSITTVAETDYCQSLYIKRNQGTDVGGRYKVYDQDNATFISDVAFTATDEWQRIQVPFTSGVGNTACRYYIEIDTSGESILVKHAQVELGDEAGAIIPTDGATASLVEPDYQVSEAHATTAGRIDMTSVLVERKNTTCYYFANTGTDRKEISQGSNMGSLVQIGSTLAVNNSIRAGEPTDTEVQSTLRWNNDLGFPEDASYSATTSSVGGILRTGTATGTPGGTNPDLIIGKRTANTSVDAFIQRIRIYDGPGDEATV